jgi:hypothetical protein
VSRSREGKHQTRGFAVAAKNKIEPSWRSEEGKAVKLCVWFWNHMRRQALGSRFVVCYFYLFCATHSLPLFNYFHFLQSYIIFFCGAMFTIIFRVNCFKRKLLPRPPRKLINCGDDELIGLGMFFLSASGFV